jgi:hypothetical protein
LKTPHAIAENNIQMKQHANAVRLFPNQVSLMQVLLLSKTSCTGETFEQLNDSITEVHRLALT